MEATVDWLPELTTPWDTATHQDKVDCCNI